MAQELAATMREAGRNACALEADLSDPGAVRALVGAAIEQLGGLEIAVTCAATLARVPLLEITDEEWDRVHAVNLRGYFAVAQQAAKHMVAVGGSGRIIMVSSVNQHHPTPGLAHYVASKGGVMRCWRVPWRWSLPSTASPSI